MTNQVFLEGNNRAAYFVMVMFGKIFDTPIPLPEVALNRKKIGFFEKPTIAQFHKMFEELK